MSETGIIRCRVALWLARCDVMGRRFILVCQSQCQFSKTPSIPSTCLPTRLLVCDCEVQVQTEEEASRHLPRARVVGGTSAITENLFPPRTRGPFSDLNNKRRICSLVGWNCMRTPLGQLRRGKSANTHLGYEMKIRGVMKLPRHVEFIRPHSGPSAALVSF